jgi:hypothetical protein
VLSDDELAEIREATGLTAAEKSFEFWDNPDDDVYENL